MQYIMAPHTTASTSRTQQQRHAEGRLLHHPPSYMPPLQPPLLLPPPTHPSGLPRPHIGSYEIYINCLDQQQSL